MQQKCIIEPANEIITQSSFKTFNCNWIEWSAQQRAKPQQKAESANSQLPENNNKSNNNNINKNTENQLNLPELITHPKITENSEIIKPPMRQYSPTEDNDGIQNNNNSDNDNNDNEEKQQTSEYGPHLQPTAHSWEPYPSNNSHNTRGSTPPWADNNDPTNVRRYKNKRKNQEMVA